MEKIETTRGLMIGQLRDMYDAGKQLVGHLEKLNKTVTDPQLKQAISQYMGQNDEQVMHLKQIFSELYIYGSGERCMPMMLMPRLFHALVKRSTNTRILDAVIIDTLQHIIHYKIAAYNNIKGYTKMLRLWHISELVFEMQEEEKKMSRVLANLAEEAINPKTMNVAMAY